MNLDFAPKFGKNHDFSKYAKNIEYRNNVNTNLIPLIINNYGSKFTSDKCGTND